MKKENQKINSFILKRLRDLIGIILLIFLISNLITPKLKAEEDPESTYNINSMQDLIDYSQAYYTGSRNKKDVLVFTVTGSNTLSGNGFISIGTSNRPFEGTLVMPSTGIDTFLLYECALFDYVSTDLKITGSGVVKIKRARFDNLETLQVGAMDHGALFANHVTKGTGSANWTIETSSDGDGTLASSYEGLIGEIAASSDVTISYTDNTSIPVSGSANIGLICGKLGANAKLTVSTNGTNNVTVTSTGANAGSLVGYMDTSSILKLNSANNSKVTTVTSNNGYAGGLVGYANNATIEFGTGITDYVISSAVTSTKGSGGIFGYYLNTSAYATFDLEDTFSITTGLSISSTNNKGFAGGIFGLLENNRSSFTFDGNKANEFIDVSLSGYYCGGVCGGYKTNTLTNTFNITNTYTKNSISSTGESGGLIGSLYDSAFYDKNKTYHPAYIKIYDVETEIKSGTTSGGLIGRTGDDSSFIDVSGTITVKGAGTVRAGLIDDMQNGILRIQGTTNLSSAPYENNSSGQIVRYRNAALIYALGDGNGVNGSWSFKRNTAKYCDDISTWGEVIRCDGVKLSESDLFTVNMTAHTVEVKAEATNLSISSLVDFAKTAINIQINSNKQGSGTEKALLFGGTLNDTILGSNITLTNDINLSGTGLTGFTRDDGANNGYHATFNGGNKTITMATGEVYGLDSNGNLLSSSSYQGNIVTHSHNGLFAKTSGATFNNLTIAGNYYLYQRSAMNFGAVTAEASGALTISGVTANLTINSNTNDSAAYFGGAIGKATGNNLNVSITGSTISPTFVVTMATNNNNNRPYYGGAIGFVSCGGILSPTQNIVIGSNSTTTTISFNYSEVSNTNRGVSFGGLIGSIESVDYAKDERTLSINKVTLNVSASARSYNKVFGGILGTKWSSIDTTIENLVISSDITDNATGDVNYGGLIQTATGHFDIKNITLSQANFTLSTNAASTFGFVSNKAFINDERSINNVTYPVPSVLYLDLDNTSTNYNIAALSFTNAVNFAVFDEIVADSRFNGENIVDNGQAIISITTNKTNGLISSSADTYLNKTTYGKTSGKTVNSYTRYYYNLEYARTNLSTPKFNFLIWSVGIYAHPSLADWFSGTNTHSGSLDMTGLSYYPIDIEGETVSFSNVTSLKLDYTGMKELVKYAYSGESTPKRIIKDNTNQHYLMHTSLFRNYVGTLNMNTVTLEGNVPKLSDSSVGFLISGILGNSDTTNTIVSLNGLTFNGLTVVSNTGGDITTNQYAPLFINNIGKGTSLSIDGAAQAGYSGFASKYAGSSLIGDVGDSSSRAIYLTFSEMKFDGRSSATSLDNLDTKYGTTKSIFSRATILNSFLYFSECSGSYTFTIEDDWTSGGVGLHNVIYGKEITSSLEFEGLQKKYSASNYYVHPTTYESGSEYDFSTRFLPYVYTAYNLSEYKHEIMINITVSGSIAGSGKYGDPYVIDTQEGDTDKLEIIAKIINGDNVGSSVTIYLPDTLIGATTSTSFNYTTADTKKEYSFGASNFTCTSDNSITISTDVVRKYLAGAYYVVTKSITLSKDYPGLGSNSADTAFKGVIIGRNNPVITNKSDKPFINTSVGCVVKGVTINVNVNKDDNNNAASHTIILAAPGASDLYDYSSASRVQSYGAVIAQIVGGDTIIDGVRVNFTNILFSITTGSGKYERLLPIGGYVGSLVNGGLIFRNMLSSDTGLTSAKYDKVGDSGYLYVNPIIGRVIAGYAFNESNTYHATEDTATLKNGLKNYTIADLNPSLSKLDINNNSTTTVKIPNGQALFILGAIVNSGAGSAGRNADTEQNYQTLSEFWQAYRAECATRAGATYDNVGSEGYASSSDYDTACSDNSTSALNKVPYIVSAYTVIYGSVYPARHISCDNSVNVQLTGDCNVAAGFRGFGSIYCDSTYLRLRINSFVGTKTNSDTYAYEIKLHMRYLEYDHYTVKKYHAYANANGVSTVAGFGLFNKLEMKTPNASNAVKDIILSGSIFYDVYATTTGAQSTYPYTGFTEEKLEPDKSYNNHIKNPTVETINYPTNLAVGGIAGYANSQFYITNVTFNNFSVEGAKDAGGIIGYMYFNTQKDNYITYDNTATTYGYINAVAGIAAGGLVGRLYNARITITGATNKTNIIVNKIEMKAAVPNEVIVQYQANTMTGAGGILGSCWAARGNADTENVYSLENGGNIQFKAGRYVTVSNIELTSYDSSSIIRVRNASESNPSYLNYAGGFFGTAHDIILHINDCKLFGISVYANAAGGVIGTVTQKYLLYLNDVIIDGNNNTANITGVREAGGVIGRFIGRDNFLMDFDHVTIKDYNFIQTYTGSDAVNLRTVDNGKAGTRTASFAAGAVFGNVEGDNKAVNDPNSFTFELNNIIISNCYIETNYGSVTYDNVGTGIISGVVRVGSNASNKVKINGYNVLLENNTLKHYLGGNHNNDKSTSDVNNTIGEIVGNNIAATPIRLIGVSIKYTDENNAFCGKICGKKGSTANEYGSCTGKFGNGQIVFADYDMATTNQTLANIRVNSDTFTNVVLKEPYVTSNPAMTIGGVTFTGDAFATSIASLPISDIFSTDPSDNAAIYRSYVGSMSTYLADAQTALSKLSMFSSEVDGYLNTDFPVLVIDDNRANDYINGYVRMITNTTYDYSEDVYDASNVRAYTVHIYNVSYANNQFSVSDTGASLKRNSEDGFYTIYRDFDSGKAQFSLIDIRFYRPSDPKTVVYHFYLPVFIKKVLSYRFDIAILGGTKYLDTEYITKYGQPLIENIGTPVTTYFKYTYSRSASEWTSAIMSGENELRNYKKTLLLYKASTSGDLASFASDTMLALVNPVNGMTYYSTLGHALLNDGLTLDLTKFKAMAYNNGSLSLDGEAFSPLYLCDLMDITVSSTGDNLLFVKITNDLSSATVRVKNGNDYDYYRLATEQELASGSTTKYSLTVNGTDNAVTESYYLSIFTTSTLNYDLFHYYLIKSPTQFSDNNYPSKMTDSTASHTQVHLIMGKIFNHSNLDISSYSNNQTQVMSATNNELNVKVSARFGLNNDLDSGIVDYMKTLINVTNVYQSFMVYLNRNSGNGIVKVIAGNPTGSGEYNVDYTLNGQADNDAINASYSTINININNNYAEFVTNSLSTYFATGDEFEIVSIVTLTYPSSAAINAQFPGHNDNYPKNGTTVSASSSLAFSSTATSYSKNKIEGDETPAITYNSEDDPESAELNLNPVIDRVGNITSMGINALNPGGMTSSAFDLLAVLDTTTIRDKITSYKEAVVTIKLQCKGDDGKYGDYLDITDYMTISIGDTALTSSEYENGKVLLKSALVDNEATITIPLITCIVKTGEDLESVISEDYGNYNNYKVTVSVVLRDNNHQNIAVSSASNFVIYTNAKVLPDFIIPN